MALSKDKRKKIEKLVIDTMSILDKSGINAKKYMDMFKGMSDAQFESYVKKIAADPNANYQIEIVPFDREPRLDDIEEAAKYLDLPLEEYVYYYHEGRNGLRTKEKVPVGWLNMKRMQQILSKKNTSSLSDSSRNAKTNQLSGEDRIARITDPEVFCLLTWNANTALKEFFSTRADNNVNRNIMRNKIAEEGYCSLEEVEATNLANTVRTKVNQDINKTTINTIDIFFTAAGIKTDLINKSYDLASTDKMIKDKMAQATSK